MIDRLAEAMDRLVEDGDLAERLSTAGRRHAIDSGFLWSSVIQEWTKVYTRLKNSYLESRQPAREADTTVGDR